MDTSNKTIIVPTFNEEKSIKTCLSHILPQLEPQDEVLVIVSGCTDGTVEKINQITDKRIKILVQKEKKGKVSAINFAIIKAKFPYIVIVDADVIPGKHSIGIIVNHLENRETGAVSAKIYNFKKENFFDKLQDFGWQALNDQKMEENKAGTFYALNGFLCGLKKEAAPKLDETSLVDDAILGFEVKKRGYQVIYEPRAKVYVKAAQNFKDYIKQKTRVRVGWWQMTEKGMKITERRNLKQLKYLFTNLYAWPYIFLDFLIWLKANRKFKKRIFRWEQIKSSKI